MKKFLEIRNFNEKISFSRFLENEIPLSIKKNQGANRTRSERVPNAFGTLKKTERVRNAVIHFITLLLPSILLQKD